MLLGTGNGESSLAVYLRKLGKLVSAKVSHTIINGLMLRRHHCFALDQRTSA
jgi:hypothetical protein